VDRVRTQLWCLRYGSRHIVGLPVELLRACSRSCGGGPVEQEAGRRIAALASDGRRSLAWEGSRADRPRTAHTALAKASAEICKSSKKPAGSQDGHFFMHSQRSGSCGQLLPVQRETCGECFAAQWARPLALAVGTWKLSTRWLPWLSHQHPLGFNPNAFLLTSHRASVSVHVAQWTLVPHLCRGTTMRQPAPHSPGR
jgi:hypothetical protein